MTLLVCTSCKREHKASFKPDADDFACDCGGRRVPPIATRRSELRQVSEKRAARNERDGKPARSASLKQGRGFAASPAQQKKAREGACIVTGAEAIRGAIVDPAHLAARGGHGGCDHPDCVVPLVRHIHEPFDNEGFNLLPYLCPHNAPDTYAAEIVHALAHYDYSLTRLIHRLSGERHLPESEILRLAEAAA